jgi:hypothetical protein
MLSTRVPEEAIVSDIQGGMVVVGGRYETGKNEEKSARWMPARMLKSWQSVPGFQPKTNIAFQHHHDSIHRPILLLLNAWASRPCDTALTIQLLYEKEFKAEWQRLSVGSLVCCS